MSQAAVDHAEVQDKQTITIHKRDGTRETRAVTYVEAMLIERLTLEMRTGREWWRRYTKQSIQLWASIAANVVMLLVVWLL